MNPHIAELRPQTDLRDRPARTEPAYSSVRGKTGVLGNGFLEVCIDFQENPRDTARLLNKATGQETLLRFSPFEAWFDGEAISADQGRFTHVEARGSGDVSTLSARMSFGWMESELSYVLFRGEHFLRKSIVFHGFSRPARLRRVAVIKHDVDPDYDLVVHDGGMFYPVVFLRGAKGSVFFCADFPGYFVEREGRSFRFDYYPGVSIEPGRSCQVLATHVGVCELQGVLRLNPYHDTAAALDTGEQQWFREAILGSAPATQLPSLELRGPVGPEGPSDLEVLDQCQWFDATHVFLPRMLDDIEAYPLSREVLARARQLGVRPVLRVSRQFTENLKWVALTASGATPTPLLAPCFGCDDFCQELVEHYLAIMERYHFRDIEVSGSPIVECHALGHGHVPGVESLQKAFQGLVEMFASLRDNYASVTGSRLFGSYGAGLTRLCDSVAPMVEDHPLARPDIHPGRLFADMQRLYFRRTHSYLLPRSKITASIGVLPKCAPEAPYPGGERYPWHLYHDSEGWRYALLSAIATTPRHRIHALPQNVPEDDRAFARHWLAWEREHLAEFRHVDELLGEPGLDAVDGYAYTNARGATVFLFNGGYDPQSVRLRLNLLHDWEYIARELHPLRYNYLGPRDGLFGRRDEIRLTLRPREARVFEVVRRSPASAKRVRPEVFGAPVDAEDHPVVLVGEPGAGAQVGVRRRGQFTRHTVRFPGTAAPTHIEDWTLTTAPLDHGRATLAAGAFPGRPWKRDLPPQRDAWLCAKATFPAEVAEHIDASPFRLNRPCWAYPDRLFFVIRFEPDSAFDPIRTASGAPGVPEGYLQSTPMKCGIDLAPRNYGLRAWVNGDECRVYPALAAWRGYSPNPNPVVAYFFEAGSRLRFGRRNHIVLFANHFEASAFRGIVVEHLPRLAAQKALDIP